MSLSGRPQPRRKTSGRGPDLARVRWSSVLGPSCLQESSPCTSLNCVSLKIVSERTASLRLAPLRSAPLRFASMRTAALRFAPLRSAPLRFALPSSALLSFAPLRFALLRSAASLRSAPLRSAPLRSAPLRSAPLRSAPLRFALLRSAPLRSTSRSSAQPKYAPPSLAGLRYPTPRYPPWRSGRSPGFSVLQRFHSRVPSRSSSSCSWSAMQNTIPRGPRGRLNLRRPKHFSRSLWDKGQHRAFRVLALAAALVRLHQHEAHGLRSRPAPQISRGSVSSRGSHRPAVRGPVMPYRWSTSH